MSSDWGSWFYSAGTGGGNPAVRSSVESNRSDVDDEVVEPDQGNGIYYSISILAWFRMLTRLFILTVLFHIISQLRPGADLSRVALPTFILEPRSMLERITKSVLHACIYI